MRKIALFGTIVMMSMYACGGNEGAFNEAEKKTQDSSDQAKQDADFESLMNDSTSKDSTAPTMKLEEKQELKSDAKPSKK